MGLCKYCGEKAGLFKTSHDECATNLQRSIGAVRKLISDGTLGGREYSDLSREVQSVLANNRTPFAYVQDTIHQATNDAASQLALQAPASESEFVRLMDIIQGFDGSIGKHLSQEYTSQMVARKWFATARLHMSYVLWQVLNNRTPDFEATGEAAAFNIRSTEQPIFQTGDCVTYAEERTISNPSRSYQGLSIPVGAGIYYHIGGSQGHQERTSGLLPLDGGRVLITTKALYFGGAKTTFKILLDHVLRYQPYVDAVGLCEQGKASKVFVFDYRGMDVGWFFYNLLVALSNPHNSLSVS
jgi:hypothetical protein